MEKLYTKKEAAKMLCISTDALDIARNSGTVAYIQHVEGGRVYFTETALQEYIARSTHRAKPLSYSGTYRKPRTKI